MIDESALRTAFADLQRRVAYLERASGLFVADDELDRPKGDIKIHFDPNGWRGPSCKGRRASECTPEFLEAYAGALQSMAERPKPGDDPKRPVYNRLDAARARSWARRLRQRGPRGATAVDAGAAPQTAASVRPGGASRPTGSRPTAGAGDASNEDDDENFLGDDAI
jgi:hypothetical protein